MKNFTGLTSEEAVASAKANGTNSITSKQKKTFMQTYWENYDNPIIIVLLIALFINILFTFTGHVEVYECAGILLSVIISTLVSSISEYSNESTFIKLQEEASKTKCKVWRDGALKELYSSDIVVGDHILIQAGDLIPADGRIAYGKISVNQSNLCGESTEVQKVFNNHLSNKASFDDFWSNETLFRGSIVCSGEAVMIADAVGNSTVYGRLTRDAQEDKRESPLSIKLEGVAKSISKFGCISAIIIVILSFVNNAFFSLDLNPALISEYFANTPQVISDFISSLIIGIIVIVVAVPEGLPLMIAIVCSLNMKKMLSANVLVRRLIGIETAGGINILFTDKTGTITLGKPNVSYFFDGLGNEYKSLSSLKGKLNVAVSQGIILNSSASFSGNKIIGGNATERALLEFVGKPDITSSSIEILNTAPFSSDKKYSMAHIHDGNDVILIKGAPELILPKCKKCITEMGDTNFDYALAERKINTLAKASMRLIAFAVSNSRYTDGKLPNEMIFVGIAVICDKIRPEAKPAIREISNAGIQVVMITGDRVETATAIAKEAGLTDEKGLILTSAQMSKLTDGELKKLLPDLRVVARALPSDKGRLVRLAQEMDLVVGMTGDGVNDAPALKLADVGFSMGSGTDAAAAASDIVILDDNFRSIRNAVLYGRTIYNSIKKFIKFQLTINVAAVAVSMLGPIVGVEKPLDISQMIWTNLMIDSLAAIAFGGEPALAKYMLEKPRKRDEKIIDKKMWSSISANGLYISALSLLFITSPVIRTAFRSGSGDIYFYTGYFCFFIFISIFNAFNARCDGIDLFENLSLNKPFLIVMLGIAIIQAIMTFIGGSILRTAPLTLSEWVVVIVPALTIFPFDIIRKLTRASRSKN